MNSARVIRPLGNLPDERSESPRSIRLDGGRRRVPVLILTLIANLLAVLGLASTAQAAPQVDPTGSNFAIWGSPSFNRQIGPDDVVVQVVGGSGFTVSLLVDGSLACWGSNGSGQCT
ncbi:MAG: hypothetical protein GY895_23095, partial [Phycisphaera sp.]|nr:hypothetical protein [Phycisphaera sp.]